MYSTREGHLVKCLERAGGGALDGVQPGAAHHTAARVTAVWHRPSKSYFT